MEIKRKEKLEFVGNRPIREDPKGSSYCNWDQKIHQKASGYTKTWGNGSCNKAGQILEFEVGDRFGKDFLVGIAKAGGKIEDGVVKISADDFEKVKELMAKPDVEHLAVVGSNVKPGTVADGNDWTKHCYMDGNYGKCVGKNVEFVNAVDLNVTALDKDKIQKIAEAGGIIEDGKIRLERTKYEALKKSWDKK